MQKHLTLRERKFPKALFNKGVLLPQRIAGSTSGDSVVGPCHKRLLPSKNGSESFLKASDQIFPLASALRSSIAAYASLWQPKCTRERLLTTIRNSQVLESNPLIMKTPRVSGARLESQVKLNYEVSQYSILLR